MKPGFHISPGLLRVAGPLLALGACQIDVEAPPEGPHNASPVASSSNWHDDHSHPDRGYDDPDPPRVDDGYERDEDDAEDRRPWWKYRDLIAIDPELVQGEPASNANPEATLSFRARLPTPDFSWPVLGVSESLRRAFSVQTCNGCHGGDSAALPFQHIAPGASPASRARLSRFLYDPGAESDELRRRAARVTTLGQTACDPPTPPVPYGS